MIDGMVRDVVISSMSGFALIGSTDGLSLVIRKSMASDPDEFDRIFKALGGTYEGYHWEDGSPYVPS